MANLRHMGQRYKQRQYEADARQVEHDVLTIAERVEKARSRRGKSKREIARLQGRQEAR